MKKGELTKDEQMVLSYLVLIDEYAKRTNSSEDCEKKTFYDCFTQVFDGMDTERKSLYYKNLISLNKNEYINFEDESCPFDSDDDSDDNMVYWFESLTISTKGMDYVRKYMKMDKKKLEIVMRKMPNLSIQDFEYACKKVTDNEIFKLISALVALVVSVVSLYGFFKI